MITAAPYRRRDHKTAGSSTCVRPQRRHLPRRGRNSSGPEGIATTRRRAQPHRASTAPQHGDRSRPAASLEAYRFRRQLYYATRAILVSIPSSYSEGVRYPSPF